MPISKRGFANLPKDEHRRVSSKGGKAKVSKGFASLSPEDRIVTARNAARTRWERIREAEAQEAINSAEDGQLNE